MLRHKQAFTLSLVPAGGGGGISGGGKGLGGGGSGGGGGDGFSGKGDEDYEAALRASGKSLDSIPAGAAQPVSFPKSAYPQWYSIGLHTLLAAASFDYAFPSSNPWHTGLLHRDSQDVTRCADMAAALAAGKVSQEVLQRYLAMSDSLLAPLMRMG